MSAVFLMFFCLALRAQSDGPSVLQQQLNSQFKLTTITADRTDIVTAGDIVVLHQPGVVLFSVDSSQPPTNTYKGGRIGQGFGTELLIAGAKVQLRKFVPGEKCWVTRIIVQNDSVVFDLYSDPYNDIRYYGTLKIAFPNKKEFPPVDSFLKTIADVVTPAPQESQASQPAAPPAPAPAPLPVIAPPPPPSDVPPPTIALGQTKDQVIASFGQPVRMAKLGAKEIYYYKDMKVTFTSGKVSNVD
jgi:hypothetical protein